MESKKPSKPASIQLSFESLLNASNLELSQTDINTQAIEEKQKEEPVKDKPYVFFVPLEFR